MNIISIRAIMECIKKRFGADAYLELYMDGSGFIRLAQRPNPDKLLVDFDGLGELAMILESRTDPNPYPSGLNRAGWGGVS